ncbi:putative Leucine Rich repeat [Leishmania utingensis]|uniref:Leucine Rich repeat n=1 Tax=Leishmania utingensis TaxID=653362 RepID=A0AAW3ALG2_9TRYP
MGAAQTSVEGLLNQVRQQAATSPVWSIDLSALLERCSTVGGHSPPSQEQLLCRVAATLASVLSAVEAPSVAALSVTLPTPGAAMTVLQLCRTTPLLSSLESLELVVDTAAVNTLQNSMESSGGHEVAALLRELAAYQRRNAGQSCWTSLSVRSRDTSAPSVLTVSSHAQQQRRAVQRMWDDTMVNALSELVATAPWTRVALCHIDLTPCSFRTRQRLWASLDSVHASLTVLDLTGMRHAHEFIASRQLCHLIRLSYLDFSHTQLSEDAVQRLLRDVQDGVGGWWLLQHLGLAQCEVSEAVVLLLHNQHEQHAKGEAPLLESLNVSGARLSCRAAFVMAMCLVQCPRLRHLQTRHCRLQPASVEDMAAGLQHATELQTWMLCFNKFGDEGVAALTKYARCWPSLTDMDLSRCRLTCASVHALSRALPEWNKLQSLRLVGNDLRWQPPQALSSSSSSGVESSRNGRDTNGLFAYDPAYMKTHGSSVKVPTSYELERRDRKEGRQRYKGTEELAEETVSVAPPLEALGEALSMCSQLRVLDLSDCAMADAQLVQLSTHFTGASLEELRLASNPLFATVPALDALVEVLWRTPNLSVLDLSFTALGDLGVSMMCDGTAGVDGGVLKAMPGLHTLLLSGCAVESLGWESLAAAVSQLTSLRHIALHHNRVSELALLEELLRQLVTVSTLRSVNLAWCVDSTEVVRRLQDCAECRALRKRGVQVLL